MTKLKKFIEDSKKHENSKVVLGLRMPDGTKELIINDNVKNKVEYVKTKYDEDLKMNNAPIFIEEYLFIKK